MRAAVGHPYLLSVLDPDFRVYFLLIDFSEPVLFWWSGAGVEGWLGVKRTRRAFRRYVGLIVCAR